MQATRLLISLPLNNAYLLSVCVPTTDFNILAHKVIWMMAKSPFPSPAQGQDVQVLPLAILPKSTCVVVETNSTLKEFGCQLFTTKAPWQNGVHISSGQKFIMKTMHSVMQSFHV